MNEESERLFEFLSEWVSKRRQSKQRVQTVFFTHRQADPDALCAAAGLSLLMEKMLPTQPEIKIIAPQGASTLGTNVCNKLGIHFESVVSEAETKEADLLVAFDVGEPELLQPFLDSFDASAATKILVDHHGTSIPDVIGGINDASREAPSKNSNLRVNLAVVDKNATSTCELITRNFPIELFDKHVSEILLVGLLYDSQHLGLATAETLEAALKLVKTGAEIENAKNILRTRPDRSEIIARLKAAQRMKYVEVGKYLFLYTEVSSFQASVARTLLDIGGDVGIAYGLNEKETRISVRSTQRFFKETKIRSGSYPI